MNRLAVALCAAVILVGVFMYAKHRNFDHLERRIAIDLAGTASLAYIRDKGCPPASIDVLFRERYLIGPDRHGYVSMAIGEGRAAGALIDHVLRIRLNIPTDAASVFPAGDAVLGKDDGAPLRLMVYGDNSLDWYDDLSAKYAREWYNLMTCDPQDVLQHSLSAPSGLELPPLDP